MLYQLRKKIKNLPKSKKKITKVKAIISKAGTLAKNVICIPGFSDSDLDLNRKVEFSFKSFFVTTISGQHPLIKKVQALRYKSFFNHNSNKEIYDADDFDNYCDHLVIIDKSVAKDFVVGTYRLLIKPRNKKSQNFYTETEFNIKNMVGLKNISLLEAGRSCVREGYRDGRIIRLLWRALSTYINKNDVDLIFGCASFPSSNYHDFANQLSYLHKFHLPPKEYWTSPVDHLKADYKINNYVNSDTEFRNLPPLIKAYIRAGAWIGAGAIVDKKFNTTDVLIILKSKNIIKRYSELAINEG